MSARAPVWFAVSLGSLNIVFALSSLLFAALNGYSLPYFFDGLIGPLLAVSFSVIGVVIASHRPGNPIGWIFLALVSLRGWSASPTPTPSTR
jgi:two-component system NarL family sensor kinase